MSQDSKPSDWSRQARRADVAWHVMVIVFGLVHLVALSIAANAIIVLGGSVAFLWFNVEPKVFVWGTFAAALVLRAAIQFLCGWMWGRLIRRFNPWYAASVFCGYGVFVWGVAIAFPHVAPSAAWQFDGADALASHTVQWTVALATGCAMICFGTHSGRESQRTSDRAVSEGGMVNVLLPLHAEFQVGIDAPHTVGVLLTTIGHSVVTIDGREVARGKGFRLRETLTFGSTDIDHRGLSIGLSYFPRWKAEVYRGEERIIGELFPDAKTLLITIWRINLVLLILAMILTFVWLGLEAYIRWA